jgi:hypothetical protein
MKQMGYLMVDHRASPGLPEDVARWAGYDPKRSGEGKVYEIDTLACSHCPARVVPNIMRTRPRALCMECDNTQGHYICDPCDYLRTQPGYVHKPFVQAVDEMRNAAAKTVMGSPTKLLMP